MAAMVRHGALETAKLLPTAPLSSLLAGRCRCYATKAEKKKGIDRKVGPKITSAAQSLAARGFLRPVDEYVPPEDVEQKLTNIFNDVIGTSQSNTSIGDLNKRFRLFTACSNEFKHTIPNSLLHTMETLEDVKIFYNTPVDVRTPLDKLKNMDLPKNLHVQYEYHRFHPETDTKFGGISAFPGSSTLVTGLKYRGKYKGYDAKDYETRK